MPSGVCDVLGIFCNSVDVHHIVPREFGGINGQTITLDTSLHHAIHNAKSDKDRADLLSNLPSERARQTVLRLFYMLDASKVQLASSMTKVSIDLSKKAFEVLSRLAQERNSSITAIARELLEKLLDK